MNIRDLINRIRTSLGLRHETRNDAVLGFLRVLEEVRVEELTCDEIFTKLDEYVECELDQKDAARLMPLIREHLDICQECLEEYETLLHVIEATEKK
jgi:hypothetical protein